MNGTIGSAASGQGMAVKFWTLFEDRRGPWIQERALREGKDITREAAELLSREAGETLRELQSEIEKCALYVGLKKRIEVQDVRETMSFRRRQLAWDFVNHLERGNVKEAGRAMELSLQQGEEPVRMLNLLAGAFRRAAAGKSAKARRRLFSRLKESDLLLKTGHGPESAAFERLLNCYAALDS